MKKEQKFEKYSERFDNDESEIGNPDTWGKRVKQETLEETAERLYPIILKDDGWDKNKQYRDEWIEGAKWQQEQNDTSKVTRVEVIQHSPPYNGRAYTNYFAKDVEIQFQDDGKTLKIFVK